MVELYRKHNERCYSIECTLDIKVTAETSRRATPIKPIWSNAVSGLCVLLIAFPATLYLHPMVNTLWCAPSIPLLLSLPSLILCFFKDVCRPLWQYARSGLHRVYPYCHVCPSLLVAYVLLMKLSLYGVTCIQCFMYSQKSERDSKLLRCSVRTDIGRCLSS